MSLLKYFANIFHFNKRKWQAVVFCLIAATLFWFLNALNKVYTTSLNFPVDFVYDNQAYIPVKPLPQGVKINVTGVGWDLFRRSLGFKVPPLTIPLERPAEVKKIVGSTLPALFTGQLDALKINFIVQDTIYLDIHARMGAWRALTVDSLDNYIREGYALLDSVSIQPDSIFVEGPANVVSTLPNPYSIKLREFNIDEGFDDEVEVNVPSLVKSIPENVHVKFKVEHTQTISDTIPLTLLHRPSSKYKLDIVPTSVQVSFRLLESKANSFHLDSVKATVDLRGYRKGSHRILPSLKDVPPFVTVLSVDSVYVTF